MADIETLPEADRLEGAPHPRETPRLIGQGAAEDEFLSAYTQDRRHHAWLITGPKGVGKATLAWRLARFLLTQEQGDGLFGAPPPPETLDVPDDHPVVRRMLAGSEPRLMPIARAWDHDRKRLKTVISVEEIRKLSSFFGLSAPDGGERVVIVDSADEMNVNAANALLKTLEEPPPSATLLLISHQPGRLLPTIRSRCRVLKCTTLAPGELMQAVEATGVEALNGAALAELAGGSVGAAVELSEAGGTDLYGQIIALLATCPRLDRASALKLAESAAGRGAEARYALTLRLLDTALARLARTGAGLPPAGEAARDEAQTFARLAPDPGASRQWAALHRDLSARAAHARAVNLDPSSVILDMILKVNERASEVLSRR